MLSSRNGHSDLEIPGGNARIDVCCIGSHNVFQGKYFPLRKHTETSGTWQTAQREATLVL